MLSKGTIDAVFILRRIQEEYLAKQKMLNMCFVDLKNAFDGVPKKVVEWAMRKKGIPEASVSAMMILYKGSMTKVKVGTRLSEEFEVNVGAYQGSVLSQLLFAMSLLLPSLFVTTVVCHRSRCCCERDKRRHATRNIVRGDIVLIAESMTELRAKFYG